MTSPLHYSWKTEILPVFISLLSIATSIYFYTILPETMTTHWDMNGIANGYSLKIFPLILFPSIILVLYGIFLILPSFDPQKENYAKFELTYHRFRTVIPFVIFIIYLGTNLVNIGYPIQITKLIMATIGFLMIFIGVSFHKLEPNWFIGIRTPWTLASRNVWKKTHKVSGYLFTGFGLLLLIGIATSATIEFALFFFGLLGTLGGTFLYSLIVFQNEKK